MLAAQGRSERLRDGLVVAIAGPPNVGKSTLMNQLARREVAIVSPHAGTTRDVIEVQLDLDGYPVTVIDTAGIRETDDPVEQEGVRRARARAAEADLVLWLVDADGAKLVDKTASAPVWLVRNKIDLDAAGRWRAGGIGQGRGFRDLGERAATGSPESDRGPGRFRAGFFRVGRGGLISRERQRRLAAGGGRCRCSAALPSVGTGRGTGRRGFAGGGLRLGGCWAGSMSRIFWM